MLAYWGRCRVDVFVNGKIYLKNEEEERERIKMRGRGENNKIEEEKEGKY